MYWVRRYKSFLLIISPIYICMLYITLVLPFQNNENIPHVVYEVQEHVPPDTLELRLDLTTRNFKECQEISDDLASDVAMHNDVKNWQRWMIRRNVCESYRKKMLMLQREWDERK